MKREREISQSNLNVMVIIKEEEDDEEEDEEKKMKRTSIFLKRYRTCVVSSHFVRVCVLKKDKDDRFRPDGNG